MSTHTYEITLRNKDTDTLVTTNHHGTKQSAMEYAEGFKMLGDHVEVISVLPIGADGKVQTKRQAADDILTTGDITYQAGQRSTLFTAWSSNKVELVKDVTITSGEFDGTGARPMSPAVYLVDRPNYGLVAYCVDGPASSAAFVCKGNMGFTMQNTKASDGMASGTYIEIRLERDGWGQPMRAMVPLHNRFEIGERR